MPKSGKKIPKPTRQFDSKNTGEVSPKSYSAFFSGSNERLDYLDHDLAVTSIFASIELDLSSCLIPIDVTVNCTTLFGNVEVIAPNNVNVKMKGTPIFGDIKNECSDYIGESNLKIHCNCFFGNVIAK